MMRARTKGPSLKESPAATAAEAGGAMAWEVRPCGMLVQKRIPGSDAAAASPAPTVRVKVKHASAYHEIYLSSQATFGELKKRLSERTGLHPQDQKVVFKDKERDSSAYLDTSGVKDGSKMVLLEDPTAQAKRLLEARRAAKAEQAAKSIASIAVEVDRLALQVSALEGIVGKGGKVADGDVLNLIELLMAHLVKLDGIAADGDAKHQRGMQVRRVQKYVEALDAIKMKNAMPRKNGQVHLHQQRRQQQPAAVVTKKWETFDSLFSPATSATTSTSTTATSSAAPTPRFDWELF